MNLYEELDKLTAPEFVASPVRQLSPDEIAEIERQIIPPGSGGNRSTMLPRLCVPPKWNRSSYGYFRGR